eukprot:TRINITY_DN25752_c0_g1_i1.p1 TRINITY_DN25752_c0_g1~~TRINITY_DN25752_c0_g1_i1.p1  ORF type:complete len:274 (+),score=74.58 TRINITY_DN25752_c0_g1_i1:81-902(+)
MGAFEEACARLKRSNVPPTYQGVLRKKGGGSVHGGWKDRYFKLYKTKLVYFTDASCSDIKGLFDCAAGSVTAVKGSSFTLGGPHMHRQNIRLDAGDLQTLEKWLSKLASVGVNVPFSVQKKQDAPAAALPPWQCSQCKVVNLGENTKCVTCGALKGRASTMTSSPSPPRTGYNNPPPPAPYADAPSYHQPPPAPVSPVVYADSPPGSPYSHNNNNSLTLATETPSPVAAAPMTGVYLADGPTPAPPPPPVCAPITSAPAGYTPQYIGGVLIAE